MAYARVAACTAFQIIGRYNKFQLVLKAYSTAHTIRTEICLAAFGLLSDSPTPSVYLYLFIIRLSLHRMY